MSFVYPQFGNPDYSGFTTEEELARRNILTSARGSPMIGAQMNMPPEMVPAHNDADEYPQMSAQPPRSVEETTKTVTEAIMQVFNSRPVTALDWLIIFVLIIAAICFAEYLRDLIGGRSSVREMPPQRMGGNFCGTCGGTI